MIFLDISRGISFAANSKEIRIVSLVETNGSVFMAQTEDRQRSIDLSVDDHSF
jgi:hypothetical protein